MAVVIFDVVETLAVGAQTTPSAISSSTSPVSLPVSRSRMVTV